MLILILLPVAFLLPPGAGAGEIIGGWEAQPHSRPYMAHLDIQDGDKRYRCGGFLVSENFVLTAAHCNGVKIIVILGAHNITKNELSRQVIPVRRPYPHQDYDKEAPNNNDIMLLQLEHKAELNEQVGLILLPLAHQRVKPGTVCSVAGWGRTSALSKGLPDVLREVDLKVLDDQTCLKYPGGAYRNYNGHTMMCVGDPKEHKASFKGDSGGPLVCGKTAQGIVSGGPSNGRPPRVYTRVSTFIPWIQETMRRLQP
ncbi:mast cell protease 1A-like [Trachemys scripta elegans]|uniref:mast cell protease 1A-like n=1 Tax=Trachemys scripta elegans TaxID=31138 RepID=UPI001557138E|nr:mast cell protease 1A-like [Trachemys scripta elegans]